MLRRSPKMTSAHKTLLALVGYAILFSQLAIGEEELVSVVVCGASVSPKAIQIRPSAGTRGALLLARGATNYGSLRNTRIFGKRQPRIIPPFTATDIHLKDGDILEIPLARIYDEMARSRQYVISSRQPNPQFTDGLFSEPGKWRNNWRYGRAGREFRYFDNHRSHLTFVSTAKELFEGHTAKLPPNGDEKRYFYYLSFDDLRASSQKSFFLQREARILAKLASATSAQIYEVTDFGLKKVRLPIGPQVNESGEQGAAGNPLPNRVNLRR